MDEGRTWVEKDETVAPDEVETAAPRLAAEQEDELTVRRIIELLHQLLPLVDGGASIQPQARVLPHVNSRLRDSSSCLFPRSFRDIPFRSYLAFASQLFTAFLSLFVLFLLPPCFRVSAFCRFLPRFSSLMYCHCQLRSPLSPSLPFLLSAACFSPGSKRETTVRLPSPHIFNGPFRFCLASSRLSSNTEEIHGKPT